MTFQGVTARHYFPILDGANNAIHNPNCFDINTAQMRGMAKLFAMMSGFGLSLYTGEDINNIDYTGQNENESKSQKKGKEYTDEETKKERKKDLEITFKIQSANKAMTTEILQNYIDRDISIKGTITKIKRAEAKDGNIFLLVVLDDKETTVEIDTRDKFFNALEMAEKQGKLF